jgi:hypothetical protein
LLERAYVDLISRLEWEAAEAKATGRAGQLTGSAAMVERMVAKLQDFAELYFEPSQAQRLRACAVKALEAARIHAEMVNNRSWTKSMLQSIEDDENIKATYANLGCAYTKACTLALQSVSEMIPTQSPVRTQIRQCSVVFLKEMDSAW